MSTTPPTVARTTFWTLDRVADALAPFASGNLPRGSQVFGRVWTDTRTIEPGDLFVALVGERFDAHDFVKDAVAKGAAGVVVSRADKAAGIGVPVFRMDATLIQREIPLVMRAAARISAALGYSETPSRSMAHAA